MRELHWLLALALVAVMAPAAAAAGRAAAGAGGAEECAGAERSLIVAMPRVAIGAQSARDGVCLRFTTGSDYQRLDWLENGKVDLALLSPLALSLLERSAGEQFCALGGALAAAVPPPHRYLLRWVVDDAYQPEPRRAFVAALVDEANRAPIVLDSHLSDDLVQLVGRTHAWLPPAKAAAPALWRRFRDRLRFEPPDALDGEDAAAGYFEVDKVSGAAGRAVGGAIGEPLAVAAQTDYLVARISSLAPAQRTVACESAAARRARRRRFPALQQRLPPEWPPGHPVREFLRGNLEPHPRGFLTRRHYRFTLDETWSILRQEAVGHGADGLSLVLTGGGVKAGYQTEVVDQLYRRNYLYNRLADRPEAERALRVDSIVGTSGGALLGVFVAAIDSRVRGGAIDEGRSLVDTLWRRGEEFVESDDIFPPIDMLRFASLLWSGIVFGLVCVVALLFRRLRRRLVAADDREPRDAADRGRMRWSTGPWLALLGLSPWVIKGITGDTGLEHIPAVSGLFYSAYIFLAIYSDQRHVFDGRGPAVDRLRTTLWLCAAGGALTIGPFLLPERHGLRSRLFEIPQLGFVTVATVLVDVGFLVLAWAIHRQAAARATAVRASGLRAAGALLVFVPLIAYLALLPTGLELFELNPRFWLWLTAATALATVATLVLGRWRRAPRPLAARIGPGLDVLLAKHPSRSLLGMRRSSRALVCFAGAWLWWNFVNAPALYGNDRAKSYFQQTLAAFAGAEAVDESACDIRFRAPLIITATSLGRGREVYYLAEPGEERRLAERPEIASDPRWISVGPAISNGALGALAFASGSPFPVFPMTRVDPTPIARDCPGEEGGGLFDPHGAVEEWLIDGGYAHNMPIDAARQLGARRVLVLSSSPLHREPAGHGAGPGRPLRFSIGRLVLGAPRLIPYLYTRSQVEDALGTEDLLVAALSPVLRPGEPWPLLVDFYKEPLERVIVRARENLRDDARIGTFESWGSPVCRLGGVAVACAELRRAVIAP